MDLNYLLRRHQVSLMRADVASCCASGLAHRGLAKAYAGRIADARAGMGADNRAMVLPA